MQNRLRITFVLPGAGRKPVGGYKIIYEYANRLSSRGHEVTVIHPAHATKGASIAEVSRSVLRFVYGAFVNRPGPNGWFHLHPNVRALWVPSLASYCIPDGDAVVASAWQTAEWVAEYPPGKGRKYYLIQQLETWHGMEERVVATWTLPLRKFVIAHWLEDFASELGVQTDYLPNGLDFEKFPLTVPPDQRDPSKVMMLYHIAEDKGSSDGLRALSLARAEIPELKAVLFGTPERPTNLPVWIEYYSCPPQSVLSKLYNESSVFVAPSWTEGWALPPAEAMMSGACLVATDIGGHRGYAFHEQTALLSPPSRPDLMAQNILRVVRNQELRLKLAAEGNRFIQQFGWTSAVSRLESFLLQDCSLKH